MSLSVEYIAGFFDGEGSVGLYLKGNETPSYTLVVSIAQKKPEILDLIKAEYGGGISFNGHAYHLQLYSQKAFNFLMAIQPYLICKKGEVDLAIEYLKSIGFVEGGERPPTPYYIPASEMNRRYQIHLQLKEMKRN